MDRAGSKAGAELDPKLTRQHVGGAGGYDRKLVLTGLAFAEPVDHFTDQPIAARGCDDIKLPFKLLQVARGIPRAFRGIVAHAVAEFFEAVGGALDHEAFAVAARDRIVDDQHVGHKRTRCFLRAIMTERTSRCWLILLANTFTC